MTFADEPQLRTVTVTYRPSTFGDKIVRFQGSTFGELQQRLIAARVPHVHSMSFVELYSPSEGFVCPLASEALPDVKDLTIAVHVDRTEAKDLVSPKDAEPVTGQPVPAHFAPGKTVAAEPEPAKMAELNKHFARKEAKMQRKLAKVSAKLETLRFKHGIAASREMHEADDRAGHHHHHHHGHHHKGDWGHSHAGHPVHGHHCHGHFKRHGDFAARGDPSGANCPAEVVHTGKA